MKVLALATSYPKSPKDSTAPFIREISHGLSYHGVELHLLIPHHPELRWPSGDPLVHLHTFAYLPKRWKELHVWGYAGSLRSDISLRPRTAAVLPSAAMSSVLHLGRLARRLRPDVLHAHWVLPNGTLAALVSKLSGIPLVVSLHGSGTFLAERHRVMGSMARVALRQAVSVTACSRDLGRRAMRLGARPESVYVIPYGGKPQEFFPVTEKKRRNLRARWNVSHEDFLIVAIGRLVAKKGFEHLIRSLPQIADDGHRSQLLIAGSGDLEPELRQLAKNTGIGARIRLLGNLDREQVRTLLQAADALAVPSVRDSAGNVDGLPNVLLEGLATGLPVVATRVGGIPDVIQHERNGLLVPERDPRELAMALGRLVKKPALRDRLGRSARRASERKLNWNSVTLRYATVLRQAAREEA